MLFLIPWGSASGTVMQKTLWSCLSVLYLHPELSSPKQILPRAVDVPVQRHTKRSGTLVCFIIAADGEVRE